MSNFTSTIEYKFKITNNLDKDNAQQKKFNFYLGLPYSKRKYRYMQVINFATNKEGQHLFNVVLGHSESSVAAMTEDILRGTRASLEPVTKVMRITYASVNVGQTSILYNDANKKTLDTGDWTGISGEYMKIKSFRTNGNDEVIGLIFDAADRNIISARKNDGTNVVAKADISVDDARKSGTKKYIDTIMDYEGRIEDLERKNAQLIETLKSRDNYINKLDDENGFLKKDLEARDEDIEKLAKENAELHNQLEAIDSKPDETEKSFKEKFIDRIVDVFRERLEALSDDELLMKGTKL